MKQKIIKAHMKTAYNYAECSDAERLKVGSIIVKDDAIISIGYNGTPKGWDNTCETKEYMPVDEDPAAYPLYEYLGEFNDTKTYYKLKTKPIVIHAERNALDKLARSNIAGNNAAMFITHAPCLECAKSIYGARITAVYYATEYRNQDGIDFLKKCNIKVTKLDV